MVLLFFNPIPVIMDYMFNEEKGLTKEQFAEAQKELERTANEAAGKEREKTVKLFFEFESSEKRNAAMRLLNELRDERAEYDDLFRYFVSCGVDAGRPDVGLEVKFSRNIPQLQEQIEALLAENDDKPKEEYETVDEEPMPEKTKIN